MNRKKSDQKRNQQTTRAHRLLNAIANRISLVARPPSIKNCVKCFEKNSPMNHAKGEILFWSPCGSNHGLIYDHPTSGYLNLILFASPESIEVHRRVHEKVLKNWKNNANAKSPNESSYWQRTSGFRNCICYRLPQKQITAAERKRFCLIFIFYIWIFQLTSFVWLSENDRESSQPSICKWHNDGETPEWINHRRNLPIMIGPLDCLISSRKFLFKSSLADLVDLVALSELYRHGWTHCLWVVERRCIKPSPSSNDHRSKKGGKTAPFQTPLATGSATRPQPSTPTPTPSTPLNVGD